MNKTSVDLLEGIRPLLRRGEGAEPFELPASAIDALARLFDRAAQHPATASARLYPVLQLVVALRGRLASPAAADTLLTALQRAPAALRIVRTRFGNERWHGQAHGLDRVGIQRLIKRAPRVDDATPNGAVPVAQMLSGQGESPSPHRRRSAVAATRPASPPARRRGRRDFQLA